MPRNETEERSGSFRPASPLASGAGWAKAADAPKTTTARIDATVVARVWAKRQPRDATLASQSRIGKPPLIENDRLRMTTDSDPRPAHIPRRSPNRARGAHSRSSEHASTVQD